MQRAAAHAGGEGARRRADPYARSRSYLAQTDARSLLNRLLYADIKTYLHELLMKQDQMSMAASIESRVPFLDHKLVEFTARLPERMKLRGLTTKYVLRRAMKDVLPDRDPDAQQDGLPRAGRRLVPRAVIARWLTSTCSANAQRPAASSTAITSAASCASRRGRGPRGGLWALVNFEMWLRRFVDGEDVAAPKEAREEVVG